MTLAAAARSIVAVGFDGASIGDAPLAELRAFAPGAVMLFARNVGSADALRELVAALRANAPLPPLICVDQEGGRVARIGPPVVALPAAMAVGAAGDVDACETLGRLCGRDLARLGVSVDLAPVADCVLTAENAVIGTRAYARDPYVVSRFAGAFARGLEAGGVAATLKHFPGHGATTLDSHQALPHLTVDAVTLRGRELVPFAANVSAGAAQLVMAAHVVVDALDPERPASLSRVLLQDVLRDELGFEGVICTDCLQMGAIADGVGSVPGAVAALAAGADLLLVSHSLEVATRIADALVEAVERGTVPAQRLRDAAARVDALRTRYATLRPCTDELDPGLPLRIAQRAVTVVRGELRLRPQRPVTVISFEGASFDGAAGEPKALPSLSSALRARRWKSEVMRVALDPEPDDLDLLLAHLPSLGDREFVVTTRRATLVPQQRVAVERILAVVPDAIVLAVREPYDAALWPQARAVGCTYGDDELAFAAAADVLSGTAVPLGRLPVPLADAGSR